MKKGDIAVLADRPLVLALSDPFPCPYALECTDTACVQRTVIAVVILDTTPFVLEHACVRAFERHVLNTE